MNTTELRKVYLKVVRTETWWPECEVPAGLTDDEVLDHINNESPASVFDEMCNKYTLETDTDLKIVKDN
tara:strand:+ start:49 stop:255 length:207 start_codon:yes stop_codon:yes gene_type:complete